MVVTLPEKSSSPSSNGHRHPSGGNRRTGVRSQPRTVAPIPLTEASVAAELVQTTGNLAAIARKHHLTRQAVSEYIEAHKELQPIWHEQREIRLDIAEDALLAAVKRGEGWAVCFLLKTLGKGRGYIERTQVVGDLNLTYKVMPRGSNGEDSPAPEVPA